MKKKLGAMLALLAFAPALFAELPPDLRAALDPAAAAAVEAKGEATAVFKPGGGLTLLPRLPLADEVKKKVDEMKPLYGVEVCLLHRLAPGKPDSPANRLRIYNTLAGVSTLKGIQYYSVTRKIMREFFIDAYRIEAPDKKNRLPDPVAEKDVPPSLRMYTFQNDSTFGENVYTIDYRYAGGAFLMRMENAAKVWYGILPLVDPGNLVYFILVYPSDDHLLFYSLVCVQGSNPLGILESRTESFYHRIQALDAWFQKQSGLF